MDRSIIHINVADFAVAVERSLDPRLRGRPMIVASGHDSRAFVYDMSEEAFQSGVRKFMKLGPAMGRCRDASILSPREDCYERAMRLILKRVLNYSPLVEMTDVKGHFFIDSTGTSSLWGPSRDIAHRIRKEVKNQMGFDPVWSVAPNKLVAKVATRLVKPIGDCVVSPGNEAGFMKSVPLELVPGVQRGDRELLGEFKLLKAGQAAALSLDQISTILGRRGMFVHRLVRGIDDSPVVPFGSKPPCFRFTHFFPGDTIIKGEVEKAIHGLVEKTGAGLRKMGMVAARVGVSIEYYDKRRIARQAPPFRPTSNDLELFQAAQRALGRAWTRRVRLSRISVICDRLMPPSSQMGLFPYMEEKRKKNDSLMSVMDKVRARFGHKYLKFGRSLVDTHP